MKGLCLSVLTGLTTLSVLTQAPVLAAPAAKLVLRPSYGGAVLEGKIYVPGNDVLTGVWSGAGLSRLMKCVPRCAVVSSIPLKNTLFLSNSSSYRIALGGSYRIGEKISVTLRLRNQSILTTQATVTQP